MDKDIKTYADLEGLLDLKEKEIAFLNNRINELTIVVAHKEEILTELQTGAQTWRERLHFYNDRAHEYAMQNAALKARIEGLKIDLENKA